jgi:hypothetical protein
MDSIIKKRVNSELKKKKISRQDVKDVKKQTEFYITELEKQAKIKLNTKLEKFVIARR